MKTSHPDRLVVDLPKCYLLTSQLTLILLSLCSFNAYGQSQEFISNARAGCLENLVDDCRDLYKYYEEIDDKKLVFVLSQKLCSLGEQDICDQPIDPEGVALFQESLSAEEKELAERRKELAERRKEIAAKKAELKKRQEEIDSQLAAKKAKLKKLEEEISKKSN